ncbi:MAG: hypothetical protein GQ565_13290 [Candidatus Aegiribacteria sp.]|nr:hypothetical protein [Candidatus Aegiribacteria sp.]
MSKRIFDREYFREYGQFLVGIEGVSGLLARFGNRELDFSMLGNGILHLPLDNNNRQDIEDITPEVPEP